MVKYELFIHISTRLGKNILIRILKEKYVKLSTLSFVYFLISLLKTALDKRNGPSLMY